MEVQNVRVVRCAACSWLGTSLCKEDVRWQAYAPQSPRISGLPLGPLPLRIDILILNRQINLHIEYLEEDFLIRSAACPPTALLDLVFVSEVPKSWTAQSVDTELINTNRIIKQPMRLSYLEKATIQTSQWLSIDSIKTILCNCPRLKHLTTSGADAKRTNCLSTRRFSAGTGITGRSAMTARSTVMA